MNEDRTLFYFLEDVVNLLGKQDNFWTNFSSTWQDVSPRENAKSSEFLDIIWKLYVDLVNKPQSPNLPNTILDGWFSFMPQSGSVRSKSCDLLSVCYAHGALKRLPNWLIKIYHVFRYVSLLVKLTYLHNYYFFYVVVKWHICRLNLKMQSSKE